MPLKAFLLCAGKGERFSPQTLKCPKVLLPFLNIPLVFYNLFLLKTLKVQQCIINTHQHSQSIKTVLKKQSSVLALSTPHFSQEDELLGSAGGLLQIESFVEKSDSFYYLNGDTLFWPHEEESLSGFYDYHVKSQALASFLCMPSERIKGVIWAGEDSQVHSFLYHKPDEKSKPFHFCGLALFSKKIFQYIQVGNKHIFKDVLENLCSQEILKVYPLKNLEILDMNQLSTYLEGHVLAIQSLLNFSLKSQYLNQVLDLFSPSWFRYSGDNYFSATKIFTPPEEKKDLLFCGKDVKGLNHLKIKNLAVIGDNCHISSPVELFQSVVNKNQTLKSSLKNTLLI